MTVIRQLCGESNKQVYLDELRLRLHLRDVLGRVVTLLPQRRLSFRVVKVPSVLAAIDERL